MTQEAEAIGIGDQRWMWWAGASSAQLAAGITWCRRGYNGSGGSMPLKAFGAASLFVSALGSAATASFFASGFESVEDVKDAGERFRIWMGALPKAQKISEISEDPAR